MKKWICSVLCALLALTAASCGKKEAPAPRLWCLQPPNEAAETELLQMVRHFDADAYVSFVPEKEIGMRLSEAMQKDDAPDVFMVYADAIPDLAENKQLSDLGDRLRVSNVTSDELADAARRACVYQGKTWGTPLFSDVYMLATDRALVATPPATVAQLLSEAATLAEKDVASVEKLPPVKQSLLFEAALGERGGKMLGARRTSLAFDSPAGEAALGDVTALLRSGSDEANALGAGKAAFSVLTMHERRQKAEKYPDAEIALSPLFGLDRLQTVAVCMRDKPQDAARSFRLVEFLQQNREKLATLYGYYPAQKNVSAVTPRDEDAVVQLVKARPAPDLCGYASLLSAHLPAAIDKAQKGVPAADCLAEAEESAAPEIWVGKRE